MPVTLDPGNGRCYWCNAPLSWPEKGKPDPSRRYMPGGYRFCCQECADQWRSQSDFDRTAGMQNMTMAAEAIQNQLIRERKSK